LVVSDGNFVAVGEIEPRPIPTKLVHAFTFVGLLEKDLRAEEAELERR
jgi:hypothetical protein